MDIFIVLMVIGAAACFIGARNTKIPSPPERREYPIKVTIGQITIHQLIITEIPLPFRGILGQDRGRIESGSGNAPMGYRISPE